MPSAKNRASAQPVAPSICLLQRTTTAQQLHLPPDSLHLLCCDWHARRDVLQILSTFMRGHRSIFEHPLHSSAAGGLFPPGRMRTKVGAAPSESFRKAPVPPVAANISGTKDSTINVSPDDFRLERHEPCRNQDQAGDVAVWSTPVPESAPGPAVDVEQLRKEEAVADEAAAKARLAGERDYSAVLRDGFRIRRACAMMELLHVQLPSGTLGGDLQRSRFNFMLLLSPKQRR